MKINEFSMKDYIVDVMVKPLPGQMLKGAIQGGVIYLISTAIVGVIAIVAKAISKRKERIA